MIHTVQYTKQNTFFKSSRARRVSNDKDGNPFEEKDYKKNTVPGTFTDYVTPYDSTRRTHVINMKQDDLNTLVKDMDLYDENGNKIKEAPLRSLEAPFWNHELLTLTLNSSGTRLNDEIPLDKFWLKVLEKDPKFLVRGDGKDKAPSKLSLVEYTITPLGQENIEENDKLEDEEAAMEYFIAMRDDDEKMKAILRAMGTEVRKPTNKVLKQSLQRKITLQKDTYARGGKETYLQMFLRLAKKRTSEYAIESIMTAATMNSIIKRNSKNVYIYGDVRLGYSKSDVLEFLSNEDNAEILDAITLKVKELDEG